MDKIEVSHRKDISIIKIQGDIEKDDGVHVFETVQSTVNDNLPFWVIDVPETNFMDSVALEVFCRIARLLQTKGGELFLTSVNSNLQEIFNITHITKRFKIVEDIDQVLTHI
jgi:anti-anti-sigma factor